MMHELRTPIYSYDDDVWICQGSATHCNLRIEDRRVCVRPCTATGTTIDNILNLKSPNDRDDADDLMMLCPIDVIAECQKAMANSPAFLLRTLCACPLYPSYAADE